MFYNFIGISLIPRPSLSFPSLAVWLRNHTASDKKLDEGLGRRLTMYSTNVTRHLTDTHITWQHYMMFITIVGLSYIDH